MVFASHFRENFSDDSSFCCTMNITFILLNKDTPTSDGQPIGLLDADFILDSNRMAKEVDPVQKSSELDLYCLKILVQQDRDTVIFFCCSQKRLTAYINSKGSGKTANVKFPKTLVVCKPKRLTKRQTARNLTPING